MQAGLHGKLDMNEAYKYDVAFSFVQKDEQLALQIADRIRDRVNVFVYTERQEVFAGIDGVDKHTRIYEDETRVVVVLHREEWGQTEWTRVEETAIKNRGFNNGYDFLVFVLLDGSTKPKWLPKTRIWVGFDRYGIDGVASAIEASVQSEGGTVHSESPVDHAARIGRKISFETHRATWLSSSQAVTDAQQEVDKLINELQRLTQEINEQVEEIQITFNSPERTCCALSTRGIQLHISWHISYINVLSDSGLYITLIEGRRRTDTRSSSRLKLTKSAIT